MVDHLDPRTTMAEVNVIKIKFKAAIMGIITTQLIINTIKDSSKIHAEDITKVMETANLVAEVVDVLEEVSIWADTAGVILEARITINTNNIMLMMIMTKLLSNMVLHVLYVADTTIRLNIVTKAKMISMISWKK